MAEYIEREALIELAYWHGEHPDFNNPFPDGVDAVDTSDIEAIPAADVAEVVRCKNCKWFVDNNGGEWYGCQMFHVVRITPEDAPKPDDFCSYGERRGGGNDNVSD